MAEMPKSKVDLHLQFGRQFRMSISVLDVWAKRGADLWSKRFGK
jgi:hypothetical protein